MSKRRIAAFILGFIVVSYSGYLTTHSLYPAGAFLFGAWGFAVLEGGERS